MHGGFKIDDLSSFHVEMFGHFWGQGFSCHDVLEVCVLLWEILDFLLINSAQMFLSLFQGFKGHNILENGQFDYFVFPCFFINHSPVFFSDLCLQQVELSDHIFNVLAFEIKLLHNLSHIGKFLKDVGIIDL